MSENKENNNIPEQEPGRLKKEAQKLKAEKDRLAAMEKTADNSIERITSHVKDVMEAFGIDKLEGERCKMWLQGSVSTEVDEDTLLQTYRARVEKLGLPAWVTCDLKVSKTELKNEFLGKDYMPSGVAFVEKKSLRIR